MDTTVADTLIGALVDGRYRIRARVARGGMATVYTAMDERLERMVALKIIYPGQAQDAQFLERFGDEAKTIARLTHPNVVAVYDQGIHDGRPYLVMEYVRGHTLRDVLAQRRRLNPQETLAIMEQMLAAIAAAHRAGLVHRDVKPENVLVAEAPTAGANSIVDGVVKVADFGLAQAVEASVEESAGGGQLMATAAYVAPELITDGHADPRADVYSAGVVLFEMLTGRVPYAGERPVDVAWQHVDRDVPPPSRYVPGLPPVLDELVARATRRDPGGRPTDAGAMLAEVQDARDDIGAAVVTRSPNGVGAQPTVIVPRLDATQHTAPLRRVEPRPHAGPDRPHWARLPQLEGTPQPRPRPAGSAVLAERFAGQKARVLAGPRGRLAVAAAIIALGVFAAVGGWWFGIGRYTTTPDLAMAPKAEAQAYAAQHGFTVRFAKGQYDEKVPKDAVLSQRPAGGERIVSGGEITLVLSLGPERYQVPDVIGKQYDLAAMDMEQIKLLVTRADTYSDSVPAGSVAETDPAVGTLVKPGAPITLKVSKGRAPITMPNVVGKSLKEAQERLERLGLSVQVEQKDDKKPKDEVVAQDPTDGTGLEKGATVTLTVSNGPPEVEVPDVTGKDVDEARSILAQAGFQVQVLGRGKVRLQNPSASSKHPPGTTITLWAVPG